jgi:hypothetical protein
MAGIVLSSNTEYIEKFVRFLQDATWHESLLDIITEFIEKSGQTNSDLDSLIMSATKKVEESLRNSVSKKIGTAVPPTESYGQKLVNYAITCDLIKDYYQPIYALLSWLFKEPRNTSHHSFVSYPYNSLVLFMSEINEALERIDNLVVTPYSANLRMNFDPSVKKLLIGNVKIVRPNGTFLPTSEKAEISLRFPQQGWKTVPLVPDGKDYWKGEYDARGEYCGTIWGSVRGVDKGSGFVASGAANTTVGFASTSCPNCGGSVALGAYTCPHCGRRLTII